MSFASPGPPERRLRITDPRALRALAHPLRLALLDHLMSFGPQTAAQCAAGVGSSPSNCSYHLRALARVGLVEAESSADRRERPWRATSTGLEFGPRGPGSPAAAAAAHAVEDLSLARDEELTRHAWERHDEQPAEWRAAETYHTYGLTLTPAELGELTAELDRLVRPYITLTRGDVPAEAGVVLLRLLAFRHPHTP